MSHTGYIVSIDAGTSKIKVVIFDDQGREVVVVIADNKIYSNHIRSELNMNELWESTAKSIRKAIVTSGIKRDRVQAVVVSGQGEGCWVVGADKKPLRNAILWNDGRAAEIVEKISEDHGLCKEIKITTGSYPRTGSTIILLKWLKENCPEEYDKIKYCISCKDWLRYKLTSVFYCEITDASTSYLNIHTNKYPQDIFAKLGIRGVEGRFPELILATDIGGYITKQASAQTLLPCGAPVAGGMLDIVSTAVGAGAIIGGDICTIIGTSCINEITTDKFIFEDNRTGWERHIMKNQYVKVAGAMAGTPNLDWGLKTVLGMDAIDGDYLNRLEDKLAQIPVGSNGLIYHPYIDLSGERAPFYNPKATGQLSGFNVSTSKYDIMRSIYEGVALSIKDCLTGFNKKGRMFLSGGGSRSLFWAQMIADCVGREVIIGQGEEFSARGSAIAASVACGMLKNVQEAVTVFCKAKHRLEPTTKRMKQFNEIFEMFREMRMNSDSFWNWRYQYLRSHSKPQAD